MFFEVYVLTVEEGYALACEFGVLFERAAEGVRFGEATVLVDDAVAGGVWIFVCVQCPANCSRGMRLPAGRQVAIL